MITPKEAARHNDRKDLDILIEAEKNLDSFLTANYHTGCSLSVSADLVNCGGNHTLCNKLIAQYRQAGWDIRPSANQLDNCWIFKAAEVHSRGRD